MNKKLISSLVAGLALSAAAVAPAQAAPMSLVTGSVTISFDSMLDQGTIGYTNPGQPNNTTATLCTSVATCNAVPGQTTGANAYGDDTWGVLNVASIVSNVTGDTLWARNSTTTSGNGKFLTGFFYGLQDFRVDLTLNSVGAPTITTFSTGGQVDLFWNSAEYNSATVSAANRATATTFTGVTGGVKAASLVFNPTADGNEPASYYRSIYNYTSNGSGGVGYLDVVAGSGAASDADGNPNTQDLAVLLETSNSWLDGQTMDPSGVYHDAALFTVFGPATTAQLGNGWTVKGSGYADSNIPEPGSMALAGLGLIGLAALRRRKQQA